MTRAGPAQFFMVLHDFDPGLFPDNYASAVAAWDACLESAGATGGRCDFPLAMTEASDQGLVCQSAWLGPADAGAVLVVIAGTHGVEGFAGTALQCDLLRRLSRNEVRLPDATAMLLVHALNPWGYANLRRCDHLGIDVNRNFVDFSRPLPDNPGFERVRPILEIADRRVRGEQLAGLAAEMGGRQFEIAFSGGQYVAPYAPFYGGTEAGFSRRTIEALMAAHGLDTRRLAVVDIHTGLGPYGYGEVICDHPGGSPGAATARAWYGPGCALPEEGTSFSVPKLGLMDYAWHRIMGADSCFVTLEFGTLGTASLFEVLLDEAVVWSGSGVDGTTMAKSTVAARMRDHFCPADPDWRESVIFRGRQVLGQALAGVSP